MLIDVEKESVDEVTPESQPEPVEVTQENQPVEDTKAVELQAKEADTQKNLRILRERAQRAEQERDEIIARTRTPQPPPEEEDLSINLNADDLAEGKHISKLSKKIKQLEQKLESFERTSTASTAEVRLRSEMPDFDSVVSKENIAALSEQYPEIAETLASNPNLYGKAKSAYKMIKSLGIIPDASISDDKARIARNASKPIPSASIPRSSSSPLSQVNMFENGITDAVSKQLYKEMLDSINS